MRISVVSTLWLLWSVLLWIFLCKYLIICFQLYWVYTQEWSSWVIVHLLSRVWLCDPMDCSMPGFPVLHYLPEFAQTHVHWADDAIQPSHPLSPPPPVLLPSICPSIGVFSKESVLWIRWPKNSRFSFSISPSDEYYVLVSFRIDWFDLLAVQGDHLHEGGAMLITLTRLSSSLSLLM